MAFYINNPNNAIFSTLNQFYVFNRFFTWKTSLFNYLQVNTSIPANNYFTVFKQLAYNLPAYKYIIIKNIVAICSFFIKPTVLEIPTDDVYEKISFSLGFHNSNTLSPSLFTDNNVNLFFYPSFYDYTSDRSILKTFNYTTNIPLKISAPNTYMSLITCVNHDFVTSTDYTFFINNIIKKTNVPDITSLRCSINFTIQGEII